MFKNVITGISAAAAMLASATGANAGGLSDEIVEAPVVEEVMMDKPAASSAPAWLIPTLILGALVAIAASNSGSGEDEEDVAEPDVKTLR